MVSNVRVIFPLILLIVWLGSKDFHQKSMAVSTASNSVFSSEQQEWIWQLIADHVPPPQSSAATSMTTSSTLPSGTSSAGNLGELLISYVWRDALNTVIYKRAHAGLGYTSAAVCICLRSPRTRLTPQVMVMSAAHR